uniref:DUF834 domain-containing protein n=1 Tax=Oryza punctata TaxID=4537 RepID=A0A0E0LE81_ORYPU
MLWPAAWCGAQLAAWRGARLAGWRNCVVGEVARGRAVGKGLGRGNAVDGHGRMEVAATTASMVLQPNATKLHAMAIPHQDRNTANKEGQRGGKNKGRRKCSPRGSRVAAHRARALGCGLARGSSSHARHSNTVREPTPIPLAQPRLGLWPAVAEQAVERLRMRMVEDGNGRARAGRGRRAREWKGAGAFRLWRRFYKVVTACAWEARHSIEQGEAKWTSG